MERRREPVRCNGSRRRLLLNDGVIVKRFTRLQVVRCESSWLQRTVSKRRSNLRRSNARSRSHTRCTTKHNRQIEKRKPLTSDASRAYLAAVGEKNYWPARPVDCPDGAVAPHCACAAAPSPPRACSRPPAASRRVCVAPRSAPRIRRRPCAAAAAQLLELRRGRTITGMSRVKGFLRSFRFFLTLSLALYPLSYFSFSTTTR